MTFDKIKVFQTFEMFENLRFKYSDVATQLEANSDAISHDWAKVLRKIAFDYNKQRSAVYTFIEKYGLKEEFNSFHERKPIIHEDNF